MHPFDVLYRGLNLTEASSDAAALLRTWLASLVPAFGVAYAMSKLWPNMSDVAEIASAVAVLTATFPVTFATFAAAQRRACRIAPDDVIELTLFEADVEMDHEKLTVTSTHMMYTVSRDGVVWRRRERGDDTPFTLTVPVHNDDELEMLSSWFFAIDDGRDDVSARLVYRPVRSGRVDEIAKTLIDCSYESFYVSDGRQELRIRFVAAAV